MCTEMTPSNWFFILVILLCCALVKMSSGKPQGPLQYVGAKFGQQIFSIISK